ncbi:MAG TPA: lactate racemase domain-containing protein [Phycisphaerae bacterium]|nr:lactate racemase domain-containing protein [Phycisphaerae bacterium]
MDVVKQLLQGVPVPRLARIRQNFPAWEVADVVGALREQLARPGVGDAVKPGMRVAVAVGSRGMAEIPTLARVTVEEIRKRGGEPFIVPAMGSHGGATAEGQRAVLANLGVTEASARCPIRSTMEVVEIGRLDNGLPVYVDKFAHDADGIVVINRVKPHTAFRGPNESGVVKMLTIGLGKQKGAESCHAYGFKYMAEHLKAMSEITLARMPILFGVATAENAYDRIARVVAMPAGEMVETDRALLVEAKANMPRFLFNQFDALIVDRIGKDISGDGMDPNITGRYPTPYASGGPDIAKIAVLDLTEATHGNANGMGAADFITRKLAVKIDFKMTYANGLTSTVVGPTHMPTVLDDDRDAILAAVKTCNARELARARVVRIRDTLHMGEIFVSESMLAEARETAGVEVLSEPAELAFDAAGNLV